MKPTFWPWRPDLNHYSIDTDCAYLFDATCGDKSSSIQKSFFCCFNARLKIQFEPVEASCHMYCTYCADFEILKPDLKKDVTYATVAVVDEFHNKD